MTQLLLVFFLIVPLNAYQGDPYSNFAYHTAGIYHKDNAGSVQSINVFNDTTIGAFYNNATAVTLVKLSHSGEELSSLTLPNAYTYKQTLLSNATIFWDNPTKEAPFVIIPVQSSTNSDTSMLLKYTFNKNTHAISLDATFGTNGIASLTINGATVVFFCVIKDGNYYYAGGSCNTHSLLVRFTSDGLLDTNFNNTGYIRYNGTNGASTIEGDLYDLIALKDNFIFHTKPQTLLSDHNYLKSVTKANPLVEADTTTLILKGYSKMHHYDGIDSFFIASTILYKYTKNLDFDGTFNLSGKVIFTKPNAFAAQPRFHSLQLFDHYLFAIGEYTLDNISYHPFIVCYDITSLAAPVLAAQFSPTGHTTYTWTNNNPSHGAVCSTTNNSSVPYFFIAGDKYIKYISLPSTFYSNVLPSYFPHRLAYLNSIGLRIP